MTQPKAFTRRRGERGEESEDVRLARVDPSSKGLAADAPCHPCTLRAAACIAFRTDRIG